MDTRVRAKRWSRLEYERLVHLGVFRPGERLELVGGALLVREPQGSPHATAIQAVQEALRGAHGPGWLIRTQMPVALDDESEPEPDVTVVPGSFRDYIHAHPSRYTSCPRARVLDRESGRARARGISREWPRRPRRLRMGLPSCRAARPRGSRGAAHRTHFPHPRLRPAALASLVQSDAILRSVSTRSLILVSDSFSIRDSSSIRAREGWTVAGVGQPAREESPGSTGQGAG